MRYYFDHNATTPLSAEVRQTLVSALDEVHGNASSIHHYGQVAKQHLEAGRRQIAALIGAHPREIVLVSGGTEANNLAIFGASTSGSAGRHRHVVTSAIEHPAVLSPVAHLEAQGVPVTRVPVDAGGLVDPEDVERALRPDTTLVSIMHANNELGTVQPVGRIAAITRERGIPFHIDGVQAAGKIAVDLQTIDADFYSLSAHKLYAPKGVGALFVRKGASLTSLLYGGHHERDRRAGTENVPGVVAFGAAAEWMAAHLEEESSRVGSLRDRLESGILQTVPDAIVNGASAPRIPNTTNIQFEGIGGEAMVIALDLKGFAVSSGSACSSGAVEPSHVLLAIGLDAERARGSVRFSLGRSNTIEQVDRLVEAVAECAAHLRRVSPAYRMHA